MAEPEKQCFDVMNNSHRLQTKLVEHWTKPEK